jgi:hypothetical protein
MALRTSRSSEIDALAIARIASLLDELLKRWQWLLGCLDHRKQLLGRLLDLGVVRCPQRRTQQGLALAGQPVRFGQIHQIGMMRFVAT